MAGSHERLTGSFGWGVIAGIAAFLCSAAAASITGTTIAADGGWTAH